MGHLLIERRRDLLNLVKSLLILSTFLMLSKTSELIRMSLEVSL